MWNKYKSIRAKAKLANVQFPSFWGHFWEDKMTWILTLAAVAFIFLMFGRVIDPANLNLPTKPINVFWIFSLSAADIYLMVLCILFGAVGYAGQDQLSRLLSKTNDRINAAIDYKTTELDKINNTLDKPTPAAKP